MRPNASDAVAAGEGALITFRIRRVSWKEKSSSSNPSGANKTQANGLKDQLDAYNNSGCLQVPVIPAN